MKKAIFIFVGFVVGFILWYLGTIFSCFGYPDFESWGHITRGFWLFLGFAFSFLFAEIISVVMWDYFYHLDDGKK